MVEKEKAKELVSRLRNAISCTSNLDEKNGIALVELLESIISGGGGTVIPGEAGQLLCSDGEGGVVANGKVRIDESLVVETGAIFKEDFRVSQKDADFGTNGNATGLILYDTDDPTKRYKVTITSGQLTTTSL